MTAVRWSGKALAEEIRAEIRAKVQVRTEDGKQPPGLAAVLIGDNPASQIYVRNKQKACEDVGIRSWLHHLPRETTQQNLLKLISELNANPEVHGVLVQMPLPGQIDDMCILDAIDPTLDVDGFHPENVGLLVTGTPRFYPCTPHGCVQFLIRNNVDTVGKNVVIVGRSNIVGKPLAMMMMQKRTPRNPAGCDATVTVAHTKTQNLVEVCRQADILIAAVGVPQMITAEHVRPGAIVIDVGINSVDGSLLGDAHPSVAEVASAITPVPGGVGPMTIAMLLQNTLNSAELHDG